MDMIRVSSSAISAILDTAAAAAGITPAPADSDKHEQAG